MFDRVSWQTQGARMPCLTCKHMRTNKLLKQETNIFLRKLHEKKASWIRILVFLLKKKTATQFFKFQIRRK